MTDVGSPEEQAEEAMREAVRSLMADADAAVNDGWQPGLCAGCGLDDEMVKGPAEQRLCRYCEELRIAPPLPSQVRTPKHRGLTLGRDGWLLFCLPGWALCLAGMGAAALDQLQIAFVLVSVSIVCFIVARRMI